MRSPVTSRSNWAKESSTFKVNRPMLVVIEGLRHRNKRDALDVEEFDQFGEVGERPCEAIDLIDDDDVELIHSNGVEQLLQGRTLETAAREAAIVIMTSDQRPALTGLALDVGFTRFPLGVERVEILFEPMIGRDARVDRTTANLVGSPCPSLSDRARFMAASPPRRDRIWWV